MPPRSSNTILRSVSLTVLCFGFIGCGSPNLSGTFSGAASGTIQDDYPGTFLSSNQASSLPSEMYELHFDSVFEAGDSTMTFTSPAGVTSAELSSQLYFSALPVVGTTYTAVAGGICGTVEFSISTDVPALDIYAVQTAVACDGSSDPNQGSFSLSLTALSALPATTTSTSEYTAHGTLQGTLPPANGVTGPVVTLSLTF